MVGVERVDAGGLADGIDHVSDVVEGVGHHGHGRGSAGLRGEHDGRRGRLGR